LFPGAGSEDEEGWENGEINIIKEGRGEGKRKN